MSGGGDGTDAPGADAGDAADWPVDLRGVTESVVTTRGPNGRWNAAALGLRAPGFDSGGDGDGDGGREGNGDADAHGPDDDRPVTAVTYGNTRTRRNFRREGGGVVQFVADPRTFVDAALSVCESDDPVLSSADAWAEVDAAALGAEERDGTRLERWALSPVDSGVRREYVPTVNRGFCAVVDATVAASRLDVPGYDTDALLDRLAYFAETVERCGGPRERAAFARVDELTGWRERRGTRGADGD